VKGSHGRADLAEEHGPLFMSSAPALLPPGKVHATKVKALLLAHVFDKTS
jgi:hypothetical protein